MPEIVELLPQQHGADGPQVVLHELAQGNVEQDAQLEDAPRSHERHALTFVHEPFDEDLRRQNGFVRREPSLLLDSVFKRGEAGVMHQSKGRARRFSMGSLMLECSGRVRNWLIRAG